MKRIVPYLFILVLFFSAITPASAGFWVKSASHASAAGASAASVSSVMHHSKAAENIRPVAKVLSPKFYHRSYRQSEWVAIGSFVFGMLGLLVPGVNFLAILLGLLSMGRGGKVQGLAIAGFVLGVLELALFVFAGGITFASLILL